VNALGVGSPAFARDQCRPLSLARLGGHAGRWNLVALGPLGPVVRGVRVALIAALLMLAASSSDAHRISSRSGPAPDGISIPSLTHGQMVVIRDNLPAIRSLARARVGFDLRTWRLEDYLNLQSFACLWGVAPGSITDEESPFNECAHAYLAAGRALLCSLPMSVAPITNPLIR
jgi:hypothetical protein